MCAPGLTSPSSRTRAGLDCSQNALTLIFFLAMPRDLWDLSSLPREQTWALGHQRGVSNHWTAREVPVTLSLRSFSLCPQLTFSMGTLQFMKVFCTFTFPVFHTLDLIRSLRDRQGRFSDLHFSTEGTAASRGFLTCLLAQNGTPLQYSWLENPMDRGAWWATVHGVAKSQTRLSDFTLLHWLVASKG